MDDTSTNPTYSSALEYVARGWAVIAVHGLSDPDTARCTCGRNPCGPGNATAGKHPVHSGWTSGPAMSPADAYAIWEEDGPDWNIGIRTGEPSGIFVLDIDPKSGGGESLRRLEGEYGEVGVNTFMVETGSGGLHYYFTMPDFPVRNNCHRIAPGVDIRGTGGMVVAPPSVSGVGAYSPVCDYDPTPAPGWLLDMLRMPTVATGASVAAEDLPDYSDLGDHEQQRLNRYARTVLEREAEIYQNAPPGRGNELLFASACSMLEIANSRWNLFTEADVAGQLDAARVVRNAWRHGGGQDEHEFRQTFQSAQSRVIGQGRPVPPDRTEGLMFDHPTSGAVATDDDATDPHDGLMFDVGPAAAPVDPVDALLARMLDRDALEEVPPPKPLIRDMLDLDSESWIIGAPGGFKSFVALDWACHVALGADWRGKKVQQGTVVYVAAEGAKGLPLRVKAWEATYGQRVDGIRFLPEPVQVSDAERWATLVGACRRLTPVLIVLDTQARITVGLEENSARDMGVMIDAVRRLKAATGACVLVVHHTGRDGGDARGSSALDGAQDTEIRVERPSKKSERAMLTASITTDKQKDGSESEGFDIQLQVVDLGCDPDNGRLLTSLAIKPANPFDQPVARPEPDHIANLVPNQQDLLEALREHGNHEVGATPTELRTWVKERYGREIARGSVGSALTALVTNGHMVRQGVRYVLPDHSY